MKRGWVRIFCLALVLVISAAAVTLRGFGVATIEDSEYYKRMYQSGSSDVDTRLISILLGEKDAHVDECTKLLTTLFSACNGAQYNFIEVDSQGTVLYRLNDMVISGSRVQLAGFGDTVLLKDIDINNNIMLNVHCTATDSDESSITESYNLTPNTSFDLFNASVIYKRGLIYLWMYDDATVKYLAIDYPAMIRTRGELFKMLSFITFAAYWLALALWVFLDARRLGLSGWKWGGWTLALNVVGFTAYIVARSHGFGPGPSCAQCGRFMDGGWSRCPYCGEKPEEQR